MDHSEYTMAPIGRVYIAADMLKLITIPQTLKLLESIECISIRYLAVLDVYELVLISSKYFKSAPMYVMSVEVCALRVKKNEKLIGVPEYVVTLSSDQQSISVTSVVKIMGEKEPKEPTPPPVEEYSEADVSVEEEKGVIDCNGCGKSLPPLGEGEGKKCETGYLCRSCSGLPALGE